MSISSLTSSNAAQQLFGLRALSTIGAKSNIMLGGTVQNPNASPVDQIQLSDQAQQILANTNAAGTAAVTPTSAPAPMAASAGPANSSSAVQNFMNYATMSPAQRMYAQILQSMGLTPQQLAAMPPAEQKAVQNKIAQMIKEKMAEQTGVQAGVSANTANTSVVAAAGTT